MDIHSIAFWFCVFFLLGVFFISVFGNFLFSALAGILIASYFLFYKKYAFVLLSLSVIMGAAYFLVFDYAQNAINLPFGVKTEFSGIVKKLEQSATRQRLILDLEPPYQGRVQINAQSYPSFRYGDSVAVSGIIQTPGGPAADYYRKEGIAGIVSYPAINLLESGRGNAFKAALLRLKGNIIKVFKQNLSVQKAAFLAGITLGERQEFSKEFEEKMSLSGTTHLVALSGYNISVIGWAVAGVLGLWFSRSWTFYFSVAVIILFVLMTGGEASIVRAAIMGIIALLAKESERLYSLRNAIVIAAFLMVIFNPRVLVFDLGFQLSFAALLGIVYLMPAFQKILNVKDAGFWNWKENALTTVSAQLAVVPILLGNFGIFSLTSFAANILILSAMPLTMGLGFVMGGVGLISEFLAGATGLIANLFLTYELWIIEIFSKFTLPIVTESFGFLAALAYYSLLILFIYVQDSRRSF